MKNIVKYLLLFIFEESIIVKIIVINIGLMFPRNLSFQIIAKSNSGCKYKSI